MTEFDVYKAAKLLFLADKYHLVRYGRPILGDEYRALPFGPIPQKTLDLLNALVADIIISEQVRRLAEALTVDRRFKYPRFHAAGAVPLDYLSKSDLMALDHVIATRGRKSFDELKALTHGMPAYRNAWERRGSMIMADMSYEDFFEEDPDAIEGALEEMLENAQLREAFPGPAEVDPADLAPFTVLRVSANTSEGHDPGTLVVLLYFDGARRKAVCVKATSQTAINHNNPEKMAGCVLYKAGEACFEEETVIQANNILPISYSRIDASSVVGVLPDDFGERLTKAVTASVEIPEGRKRSLLAMIPLNKSA